jgi:hypothetical protein
MSSQGWVPSWPVLLVPLRIRVLLLLLVAAPLAALAAPIPAQHRTQDIQQG